jgi:hypothetical protein
VRFSIFLCFFFRMRLRRFLISEPMTSGNLAGVASPVETTPSCTDPQLGEQGSNLTDETRIR